MDLRKKGFQLPKVLEFDEKTLTERSGRLVVEPLERGFGITIGNALRRILLSSLEGAGVTHIRIPGVLHEFDTIDGVKQDVVDIILNVKQLRMRMHGDGERKLRIRQTGPKEVRGADIETDTGVEILNPDILIATLDKGAEFEMEMTVKKGRGFVRAEQNKDENLPVDVLAVDSIYTPIELANFEVENARVGRSTDYDRLFMDIHTDGSISPEDALSQAANILIEHAEMFVLSDNCGTDDENLDDLDDDIADDTPIFNEHLLKSIEELELSVRSYNCLKNADIEHIADLVQRSEQEMLKTKNFGRKSLTEIKSILRSMGLKFGMRIDTEALEQARAARAVSGGESSET